MSPITGDRGLWHGSPVTHLRSADGATAIVADHGAQLLSWCPAGVPESLFLSTASKYGPHDAIRGGVPIIFPQFGERGRGQRHGFARISAWTPMPAQKDCSDCIDGNDGAAVMQLSLAGKIAAASMATTAVGELEYALMVEFRLGGTTLEISLTVENRSSATFNCHAALHSYLAVDDLTSARIDGLQGVAYLDQVAGSKESGNHSANDRTDPLAIIGEVDRIYGNVTAPVHLHTGSRVVRISQEGFSDIVVWNPGRGKGAQLADLQQHGYAEFVCIEAASVLTPLTLRPGASWIGRQGFQISKSGTVAATT